MKRLRSLDFSTSPAGAVAWITYSRLASGLIGAGVLLLLLSTTMGGNLLGKQVVDGVTRATSSFRAAGADTTVQYAEYTTVPANAALRDLPTHPADKLSPYMNPAAVASSNTSPEVLEQFHDLLSQFAQRQGQDDNFTVRVIDGRTNELLELYELEGLRTRYRDGESLEWRIVDQERRKATQRLVDKYDDQGIPREDIVVRWGRANQIQQAQERNRPYQAYEIQLAHYLDLSLLPTQIATVETFNQDDLVSPVGARSRYQMMPWILRRSGVNEYSLSTEAGSRVEVEEAHHPLLTLEPAFLLLRGYINAVGHEIPGLSAYHTGPGNIYKLYRHFYTSSSHFTPSSSVVDAYMWALTEGFDTVSENSTFGSYSRGYVPSAYGALSALDQRPLDLSESMRAIRAQLRPGTSVMLRDVLTVLDTTSRTFDWGHVAEESTTYDRFRAFNKHMDLPSSSDGSVPTAGNVKVVSTIDGKSIRFFLPLGAPEALKEAGLDVIDPDLSFRFDGSTFTPPSEGQRTVWDKRYDALVDDIKDFGFTPSNRQKLLDLHDKFKELAEENPTRYRKRQLDIIQTHRRIWRSNPWEDLSDLTMQVSGYRKMPVQPPIEIPMRTPSTSFLDQLRP